MSARNDIRRARSRRGRPPHLGIRYQTRRRSHPEIEKFETAKKASRNINKTIPRQMQSWQVSKASLSSQPLKGKGQIKTGDDEVKALRRGLARDDNTHGIFLITQADRDEARRLRLGLFLFVSSCICERRASPPFRLFGFSLFLSTPLDIPSSPRTRPAPQK